MLRNAGAKKAFLPERFDNGGEVNFPEPETRTNADAIETAAAMLGHNVTQQIPAEAGQTSNPFELVRQVESVSGFSVVVSDISFDQLLSGRVPLDMGGYGHEDYVAIVYIMLPDGSRWVPHVYHPPSGLMASYRSGTAIWTGTITRGKAEKKDVKERTKAFLNTVQLSIKKETDGPVQPTRCKIFFLRN